MKNINKEGKLSNRVYKPLTNCLSTKAWLSYLMSHGYNTQKVLDGIDYKQDFLLDDDNWISADQCYKIAANISFFYPDEKNLFRRIALWAVNERLSKGILVIAGSTLSPHKLYNSLSEKIIRFNRHRECEIYSNGKGKVIVKFKHMTHVNAQKEICEWTGGLLEAAPMAIGNPPAEVREISCECNGDEYCTYQVQWKTKINLFQRVKSIFSHKNDMVRLQSEALEESLEKLLERYEELSASEKTHRTLVETIRDIVYTIDLEGKFTYVSPMAEIITGYNSSELIGANFLEIVSPAFRELVIQRFKEGLQSGETSTYEIEILTKDKRTVPIELNATPLTDNMGQTIGRIGVARDITRRKIDEAKRQDMEVKALTQDKLASLGEIATGVAHEINQPLSYIKVILQSTLYDFDEEKLDKTELSEDFSESLRQVGKISNIISHLRTFGRSDVTTFGPVKFADVLDDTLILMRERLRIKNIYFNSLLTNDLPLIYGNPVKLEQVVLNLIQNSMDALEEVGKGEISLKAQIENDEVVITYSDTGIGVDAELQEKVFEPFFTTKEPGKGTGIGLSIVYGIIQEHKGSIACITEPGQGATFNIRLPIYSEEKAQSIPETLNA